MNKIALIALVILTSFLLANALASEDVYKHPSPKKVPRIGHMKDLKFDSASSDSTDLAYRGRGFVRNVGIRRAYHNIGINMKGI